MKQLIAAIRAYCISNHEHGQGCTRCIESWTIDDYVSWIEEHNIKSVADFKNTCQLIAPKELAVV